MATFALIVISIWAIYGLASWHFLPMSGVFPAGFFSVMIWATVVAVVVWLAGYLLAWWFRPSTWSAPRWTPTPTSRLANEPEIKKRYDEARDKRPAAMGKNVTVLRSGK